MLENSTSKIFRSSVKKNNNLCLNFNNLLINKKLSRILTISGSPNSLHLIVTDVIKVCGPPKEPWYFTFLSLLASNSYAPGLSWKYWKLCYKTMPMLRPSATLLCLFDFFLCLTSKMSYCQAILPSSSCLLLEFVYWPMRNFWAELKYNTQTAPDEYACFFSWEL